MAPLVIRRATPDDAPALARLNRLFNGDSVSPEQLAVQIRASAGVEMAWLAEVAGQAVGFACVRLVPTLLYGTPYVELTELYVEENFRRAGVGRALLAEAEALARQAGADTMLVLTGFDNTNALKFYRALGYVDYDLALQRPLSPAE